MQVCTSLQTDNHASTPPLSFLQAGCPSCRPTNSVKALKAYIGRQHWYIISCTPDIKVSRGGVLAAVAVTLVHVAEHRAKLLAQLPDLIVQQLVPGSSPAALQLSFHNSMQPCPAALGRRVRIRPEQQQHCQVVSTWCAARGPASVCSTVTQTVLKTLL